jgi:hypothetical protein
MPDPYLFTRGHTGLEFPSLAYGDPPTEPIEVVATNPTGCRIGDLTVFFDEPAARDIEVAGEDGWHSARDATMVIDEIAYRPGSFFLRAHYPAAGRSTSTSEHRAYARLPTSAARPLRSTKS